MLLSVDVEAGNCFDNAIGETFFKTLKTEMYYHRHFATRHEARTAVFDFIATVLHPDSPAFRLSDVSRPATTHGTRLSRGRSDLRVDGSMIVDYALLLEPARWLNCRSKLSPIRGGKSKARALGAR